jgi:hypothetical protein
VEEHGVPDPGVARLQRVEGVGVDLHPDWFLLTCERASAVLRSIVCDTFLFRTMAVLDGEEE